MIDGLQPRAQNIAGSLLGAISDPTPEQFASDPAYMAQMQRAQFGDRPIALQSPALQSPEMMGIPAPSPEVADMLREKMQAAPLGLLGKDLAKDIAARREFRQQQQEPEKKGFLSGLKNFVSDPAAMAQMAIAFNSMRLNPDQGLAQSMQNVIERQGLIRSGNATAQALRKVGTEVALKYADAIAAYPTEAADLYKAYLEEVGKQPEETFRTLSDEEKTALGLPEDGTYQINNLTGKVSSIGGSGVNIAVGGTPTVGEMQSGQLANRLEFAQQQIQEVLQGDPTALQPRAIPELFRKMGLEFLQRLTNPEERQIVEAAQRDMLDAALTLGTGAAYTAEQIEGYRQSYFPQLGDKEDTIQAKADRLEQLIQSSLARAGRGRLPIPASDTSTDQATIISITPRGTDGN